MIFYVFCYFFFTAVNELATELPTIQGLERSIEGKISERKQHPSTGLVKLLPIPESAGLGQRVHSYSSNCPMKLIFGETFGLTLLMNSYALSKVCP